MNRKPAIAVHVEVAGGVVCDVSVYGVPEVQGMAFEVMLLDRDTDGYSRGDHEDMLVTALEIATDPLEGNYSSGQVETLDALSARWADRAKELNDELADWPAGEEEEEAAE